MLDWAKIDTVLLDMDGTILDLHFDNHFWLEHLPKKFAQANSISIEQAQQMLKSDYELVSGTIKWYCLDYWAEKTNMPINELKREVQHLIALREDAHDFLSALRASGRKVILVTNAHPDSLSLKIEQTQLDKYFDKLYSTHQFGATKESQLLWHRLQEEEPFEPEHTLFVDDSLPILLSAKKFGIQHLLAVANPDSKKEIRDIADYPAVVDYREFVDDILSNDKH